jgi:NAD(P)-dependent dehydrogenase (short-subunit alcohol dehydrogenase family)
VHYRSSEAEAAETVEHLRRRGVEAEPFQADLSDENAVRDLVRGVLDRFGRLENIALAMLHFTDNDFVAGVCLPIDGGRTIDSNDNDGS